jgi:GNAT superfamily N-acetyltransferase
MGPGQAAPRPSWTVTSGQQAPEAVDRLLSALPGWFGIESSNVGYVEAARTLPTYLAWPAAAGPARTAAQSGEHPAGVLLVERHFPGAAEIHLLAVQPDMHRRGAGRALVGALERDLAADGVRWLQVKTLGPSFPDEGYEQTRRFYLGVGFEPLQEITGLWPENPCLIMVKTLTLCGAWPLPV